MAKTSDDAARITQRRAKRKKKKSKWIMWTVAGLLVLYLALSVFSVLFSQMTTTVAMKGTVEEVLETKGYVFRNQVTVPAPAEGFLESRVQDGERVNQGQTVAYLYYGEYEEEQLRTMRALNDKIAHLEETLSLANTYAGNSVMVEQKIALAARDLSDSARQRDLSVTKEHGDYLDFLIEKKYAMNEGGVTDVAAELEACKAELSQVEDSVGGTKFALNAPIGGVLSYKIDGMEAALSVEQLEGLSVDYMKELDKQELKQETEIVANEPILKVVDNYGWYYAAVVSETEAKNLPIGHTVSLEFPELSDLRISAKVHQVSTVQDSQQVVVFYTNRFVESVYATSRTSAKIMVSGREGIRLPVESIHVKDGQAGVYVIRLDVARFVPVDVVYDDGKWAIVRAIADVGLEYKLQIYDEVIVEAKNLEDGKVVR